MQAVQNALTKNLVDEPLIGFHYLTGIMPQYLHCAFLSLVGLS